MANSDFPEPGSILTTNSSIFFADALINNQAPLTAYNLFDLSKIVEEIVLFEKIYVLPSHNLQRTVLSEELTRKGILKEVPLDNTVTGILDVTRIMPYERTEIEKLAYLVSRVIPVNEGQARYALRTAESYAMSVWRSPFGYGSSREWFMNGLNDEIVCLGLWQESVRRLDESETDFIMKKEEKRESVDNIIREIVLRGEVYLAVSAHFGIDFRPDIIRMPITAHRLAQIHRAVSSISKSIEKIQKYQTSISDEIKKDHDMENFEVELPAVFSILLADSKEPSDIISKALEYRRSWNARSFRKWMIEMDRAKSQRTFNRKMLKEGMEAFASTYKKDMQTQNSQLQYVPSITVGPDVLSSASIDLTNLFTSSFRCIYHYLAKPHIVFMEKIKEKLDKLESNSRHLREVFGSDLGDHQKNLFAQFDSTLIS